MRDVTPTLVSRCNFRLTADPERARRNEKGRRPRHGRCRRRRGRRLGRCAAPQSRKCVATEIPASQRRRDVANKRARRITPALPRRFYAAPRLSRSWRASSPFGVAFNTVFVPPSSSLSPFRVPSESLPTLLDAVVAHGRRRHREIYRTYILRGLLIARKSRGALPLPAPAARARDPNRVNGDVKDN